MTMTENELRETLLWLEEKETSPYQLWALGWLERWYKTQEPSIDPTYLRSRITDDCEKPKVIAMLNELWRSHQQNEMLENRTSNAEQRYRRLAEGIIEKVHEHDGCWEGKWGVISDLDLEEYVPTKRFRVTISTSVSVPDLGETPDKDFVEERLSDEGIDYYDVEDFDEE